MNAFKLGYVLVLIGVSIFSSAFSEGTKSSIIPSKDSLQTLAQKYPDYKFNFTLPINVYEKNIILNVVIPKDLKLEHETPGNPHYMQFGDEYTLVTISNQTGGTFQANKSLDNIVKAMQAKTQVTILQTEDHNYPGYSDGYRLVKLYNAEKGSTEIVYIYAASGPYDSASVLYAMKMHGDESVDTLLQKVKNAFNASVKIIDKGSSPTPGL